MNAIAIAHQTHVENLAGAVREYTRDLLGEKGRIPTNDELTYFISTWILQHSLVFTKH